MAVYEADDNELPKGSTCQTVTYTVEAESMVFRWHTTYVGGTVTDIRYIASLDVMEVFGMHDNGTQDEPDPFTFILGLDLATDEDSGLSCARQRGAILRAYGEADNIAVVVIFSGAFTWAGGPKGVLRKDQPRGEVATHHRVLDRRSQSQFIKG